MNNNLRQLRKTLGLSQRQLAKQADVPAQFVSEFERNTYHKRKQFYGYVGNIHAFLSKHNLELQMILENQKSTHYNFICGNLYKIRARGDNPDNLATLIYIGKQGKHHCFKASPGGWSRTYTDPQLIGKKIEEVNDE